MSTFFSRLSQNEEEIVYLQSQDGNIFRSEEGTRASELSAFGNVIARDVAWMKEATGESGTPSAADSRTNGRSSESLDWKLAIYHFVSP